MTCERDTCRTCGQQVLGERDPAGRFQCYHCAETPRTAPPVTALRLFEPAPDQMPGQTWIGGRTGLGADDPHAGTEPMPGRYRWTL